MSDFFKTRAGMQFYQSTMPRIAEALERIASSMERQEKLLQDVTETKKVEEGEKEGYNNGESGAS